MKSKFCIYIYYKFKTFLDERLVLTSPLLIGNGRMNTSADLNPTFP